jgi:hypothetical protein
MKINDLMVFAYNVACPQQPPLCDRIGRDAPRLTVLAARS